MAGKTQEKGEAGKQKEAVIYFKCRLCEKEKPLADMRAITRFNPPLVVCQECAKILR